MRTKIISYSIVASVVFMELMINSFCIYAQVEPEINYQDVKDSLSRKEVRKINNAEMKQSNSQLFINLSYVFAKLNTTASFELPSGLLTAKLGLEENLGLPDVRNFITGSLIYRINLRSGIYMTYYGINREKSWQIDQDIIFLNDTIHAGSNTQAYFNTQVISTGYLFAVLKDPNTFLGTYLNIYVMMLKTGVKSDLQNRSLGVKMTAPLPNFGLVAMFRIAKWLSLDANIGFFALQTKTLGGSIYNLNISFLCNATKWLGFNLSYQEFDVNVDFPSNKINTNVDYNFRGPALGVQVKF